MVEALKSQYTQLKERVSSELLHIKHRTVNLQKEIGELTVIRDELGVAPYEIPKGRVLLDVGGFKYSTTMETLTKVPDSFLGRMFSGRFPIKINEEDGRILIDRDGTHFHLILLFLRDPEYVKIKIKDRVELEDFKAEVAYYGLTQAIFGNIDLSTPDNLDWLDNTKIQVHSFSSQYSGFPATNTLNPSTTYWLSQSGLITDQWIVYQFPTRSFINKIMMKVDMFECTAKDWMVQITEDDEPTSEWITVKDFQSKSGNETQSDQFFEEFELRAKYVRLFFKNNWGPGGGSYILVTNVKFFGGSLED